MRVPHDSFGNEPDACGWIIVAFDRPWSRERGRGQGRLPLAESSASVRSRPLHLALFGLLATCQLRREPLDGAPHLSDLGEGGIVDGERRCGQLVNAAQHRAGVAQQRCGAFRLREEAGGVRHTVEYGHPTGPQVSLSARRHAGTSATPATA